MFRATLTISKIACEKNAQHALGVFVAQISISRRLRIKCRGAVNQYGSWLSVNAMLAETKGVLAYRSSPRVNTPAGASMSKVSVLVVDDATFIRDLVKKGLRNYFPGIHTEDAVNGRKAQTLLGKEAFDLILCDWEMPEMSGLELLTWCREQDNYLRTVPVHHGDQPWRQGKRRAGHSGRCDRFCRQAVHQ